jgi:hypothetical protein
MIVNDSQCKPPGCFKTSKNLTERGFKNVGRLLGCYLAEPAEYVSPATGRTVIGNVAEAIAATLINRALAGDARALRLLLNCAEGKPRRC